MASREMKEDDYAAILDELSKGAPSASALTMRQPKEKPNSRKSAADIDSNDI
jgi:hypothetical protein